MDVVRMHLSAGVSTTAMETVIRSRVQAHAHVVGVAGCILLDGPNLSYRDDPNVCPLEAGCVPEPLASPDYEALLAAFHDHVGTPAAERLPPRLYGVYDDRENDVLWPRQPYARICPGTLRPWLYDPTTLQPWSEAAVRQDGPLTQQLSIHNHLANFVVHYGDVGDADDPAALVSRLVPYMAWKERARRGVLPRSVFESTTAIVGDFLVARQTYRRALPLTGLPVREMLLRGQAVDGRRRLEHAWLVQAPSLPDPCIHRMYQILTVAGIGDDVRRTLELAFQSIAARLPHDSQGAARDVDAVLRAVGRDS